MESWFISFPPRCEDIKTYIMNEIGRGVTVLDTRGGYTNEARVMMISVLSSRQLVELKDKIKEIDEKSFFGCRANFGGFW